MNVVLLVEDDALVRAAVKRVLKSGAYDVREAKDGFEGLEMLRALDPGPSLILLDWRMPRMDGDQFVRALRDDEIYRSLPIVVLTGTDIDDVHGVRAILRKPFASDELLRIVRELAR